jgi:hypothetical protein
VRDMRKSAKVGIKAAVSHMMDWSRLIDECTTLAERCDLVGIREAHRAQIPADTDLIRLITCWKIPDGESIAIDPLADTMMEIIIDRVMNGERGRQMIRLGFEKFFGTSLVPVEQQHFTVH